MPKCVYVSSPIEANGTTNMLTVGHVNKYLDESGPCTVIPFVFSKRSKEKWRSKAIFV